jgi:hypothetical protein
MGIIIISFVDLLGTKNKKVSEIGLICIYTLSATHCRRTIVITCMFSCICCISNGSIFVIWIWSRNLFTYFVASLWHYCRRSSFLFWMLWDVNITFALVTVFHKVLIITTHNSTVVIYFCCLMYNTIICILIYMIWWM